MRKFMQAAALGGAFALLLCVSPAQAQPELLSNGNLDAISISSQVLATPTDWDVEATRTLTGPFNDGASSEPWAGPAPTPVTPADQGLFFKPFQGSLTSGDLITVKFSQLVAASPGLPYILKGWAGAEPNYVGLSDPTVGSLFQIEFLNAGAALISSATLDLRAAGLGVPNGHPFAYREFTLSSLAPAGTAFVRAGVLMVNAYANPLGGGQAFVVDDFSLKIPEPASLGVLCVSGLALLVRRRGA